METIEQAIELFGDGSVDGTIGKLIDAGFASLGGHHGQGGWRIVSPGDANWEAHHATPLAEPRLVFIDHWGGAWAMPIGSEVSAKDQQAALFAAGGVSHATVVATGERFRP